MKKIVKQVVGIDVAQKELVVSLGRMYDDWTPELFASKTVDNTQRGFDKLLAWVKKLTDPSVPLRYVMEATGVYHERLAYYLDDRDLELTIVLPNKISNFFKSLEVKTTTDKTASEAIARFGLERKLDRWKRPRTIFKKLRQLTREREQLVATRTVFKNQLHAETVEVEPSKNTIARLEKQIQLLDKHQEQIQRELKALIQEDSEIKAAVKRICTITGIGELTAVTVLAETNGFDLIRNKRQLTSYAGLDVREKQSGTSVKGKPKISKRGNRFLRKAMHMPSMAAVAHDDRFKVFFARLVSRHGIKMKALVAVQRKLLELTYVIYKSGTAYDKDYLKNQKEEKTNVLEKLERS